MEWGSLLDTYLSERCRAGHLRPKTAGDVGLVLRRFARDMGDTSPEAVREADIDAWLGSRCVAPGTRRRYFSILRAFFRWMEVTERIPRHPMAAMRPPRQPRLLPRGLPAESVRRLLDSVDVRGQLVISLMVQEGLRCVEVANLQLGDIDFTEGAEAMLVTGKGGHQRVLPLSDETLGYLRRYLAEYPASAGPLIRTSPLAPRPHEAITARRLSKLVVEWMSVAGIKRTARDGVSAHALRHTCATDMLRAGAHVRDVQAALGHQNLQTTSIYMPLVVGELRQAMGGRRYAR